MLEQNLRRTALFARRRRRARRATRLTSHTFRYPSSAPLANTPRRSGHHCAVVIPSLCRENVRTQQSAPVAPSLRRSQSFTAASAPPVTTRKSSSADQSTVCRSSLCASNTACAGLAPAGVPEHQRAVARHRAQLRPLDPGWNATSSTVSVCLEPDPRLERRRARRMRAAELSARLFGLRRVALVSDLHTPTVVVLHVQTTPARPSRRTPPQASRRTRGAGRRFPRGRRAPVRVEEPSRGPPRSPPRTRSFSCAAASPCPRRELRRVRVRDGKLRRASNSRILFTSPRWMIFFQLLTNGERLSSSNARCSAAATRRLTTSTFVTTSVFGTARSRPSARRGTIAACV